MHFIYLCRHATLAPHCHQRFAYSGPWISDPSICRVLRVTDVFFERAYTMHSLTRHSRRGTHFMRKHIVPYGSHAHVLLEDYLFRRGRLGSIIAGIIISTADAYGIL